MEGEFRLGQVVESVAGRDRGKRYLVVQHLRDRFWAVADGRMRPVSRPKSKNARHLLLIGSAGEELEYRLQNGGAVSDQEVRQVLEGFGTEEE